MDLATQQQPGSLASGFAMPEGFESLDQSDLIIPRWTIVQSTTNYEGSDQHIGEFRRNIDGAYVKTLDVVMLSCARTRLLWSGDLTERRPECFSRDAVIGSQPRQILDDGGEGELAVYGTCGDCGFNPQFNRELMGQIQRGDIVKSCNFGYTFLMIDNIDSADSGMTSMALLGAMGNSVRPCKTLISQFVTRRKPTYSAIVTLDTEKQTNDRGKFYVLKPFVKEWLTGARLQQFAQACAAMKGAAVRDYEVEDLPESAPAAQPTPTVAQRRAAPAKPATSKHVEPTDDDEGGLPF